MHKSQSLFCLRTVLHVSGFTITHLQEHKTTVTTVPGNHIWLPGTIVAVVLCSWRWV